MKVKISLIGVPGVGKTQTVLKTIDILEREGKLVGGIITERVMDGKEYVGLRVLDWHTKRSMTFAHRSINSRVRTEGFGVDLRAFDHIAIPAIEWSKENADVVVIDEVGRIEQESRHFTEAVGEMLELDRMMILTLHKKGRNAILQQVRTRDDFRSLEVTQVNRVVLPYRIAQFLREEA